NRHNHTTPNASISPAPSKPEHCSAISTLKVLVPMIILTGSAITPGVNRRSKPSTILKVRRPIGAHSDRLAFPATQAASTAADVYSHRYPVPRTIRIHDASGTTANPANAIAAIPITSHPAAIMSAWAPATLVLYRA